MKQELKASENLKSSVGSRGISSIAFLLIGSAGLVQFVVLHLKCDCLMSPVSEPVKGAKTLPSE